MRLHDWSQAAVEKKCGVLAGVMTIVPGVMTSDGPSGIGTVAQAHRAGQDSCVLDSRMRMGRELEARRKLHPNDERTSARQDRPRAPRASHQADSDSRSTERQPIAPQRHRLDARAVAARMAPARTPSVTTRSATAQSLHRTGGMTPDGHAHAALRGLGCVVQSRPRHVQAEQAEGTTRTHRHRLRAAQQSKPSLQTH